MRNNSPNGDHVTSRTASRTVPSTATRRNQFTEAARHTGRSANPASNLGKRQTEEEVALPRTIGAPRELS